MMVIMPVMAMSYRNHHLRTGWCGQRRNEQQEK
jgi:hypothetical protein